MGIIQIHCARMVSPTELGLDAEVGFFHNVSPKGPRYVELNAIINGCTIQEKIPVTDIVGPGEFALLEWPHQDRLKIDLDKFGVDRFIEDEEFELTAIAYASDDSHSNISTFKVKIPLPVIILHGYIIKKWWKEGSYWQPYNDLQNFLKTRGYDDSESGYRTIWGQPDIRYSPQDATPADITDEMDRWIKSVLENTYAGKINIIGVSLGGLIARYYITEYNAFPVHKLIMVTTVNEGSSLFEGEFFIESTRSRAEAQAFLLNSEGKENLSNWLFPTYQSLYTPNGQEISHPFKNLFHAKGYDKPAPPNVHYYSIFSAERESPYELYVEEEGDWFKLLGDKRKCMGDGNGIAQTFKTFGNNILVQTKTHHAFMLSDSKVQSTILNALKGKPMKY